MGKLETVVLAMQAAVAAALHAIEERDAAGLAEATERLRALRELHYVLTNHPETGKD